MVTEVYLSVCSLHLVLSSANVGENPSLFSITDSVEYMRYVFAPELKD